MSGFYLKRSLRRRSLDENDCLRAWNVETATATHIPAGQHVVYPDEIVARLLKPRPVLLVRAFRGLGFLCPLQPPNVVLGTLATVGTTVRRFLNLFFLIKEIAFVHWAS